MRVTLNLDENLAIDLMKITGVKTKTEAINKAMAELIHRKKIEKLKSLSGKIHIDLSPAIKDKKVKKQASLHHDLDAITGLWTKAEATAFDKTLAKQRTIDPMQSKRN